MQMPTNEENLAAQFGVAPGVIALAMLKHAAADYQNTVIKSRGSDVDPLLLMHYGFMSSTIDAAIGLSPQSKEITPEIDAAALQAFKTARGFFDMFAGAIMEEATDA